MESVVTSNEVLHADLANSQARSQGMAAKVDHIADRVDLLYKDRLDRKNPNDRNASNRSHRAVFRRAVRGAADQDRGHDRQGRAHPGAGLLAPGGVVTGFVGGVPADPGAWVTCAFAVVGGVQAPTRCSSR